jgi:hypothetical protein
MYYREDITIGHLAIALLSLNSRKLKSTQWKVRSYFGCSKDLANTQ